ncbi:preprotein translocase subunit YajC [Terrilactibacillus sp. BCM23-1]|uniref:Preprotein translocase subunit YajC n=1 Tax=Terrilactibacillus tamarindi TaxID=2599694 RepID=A0A6N8CTP2_9BACI|nr:preprotein translocase subunit YajC [Terrilactibacillus tamarindi]MTT32433.1 preprotein translocase subunit YajC [Terrilactibacillus tamarindi]
MPTQVIMLIVFVAIFYFLLIRPQMKRTKETRQMQSSLQKGDKIVTIGGLHGTIDSITDAEIVLKAGNARLTFDRGAIRDVSKSTAKKEVVEKVEDKSEE